MFIFSSFNVQNETKTKLSVNFSAVPFQVSPHDIHQLMKSEHWAYHAFIQFWHNQNGIQYIFVYSIFVYFSGLSNLNVLSHNHAVSMRIVSTCVLKRCRWPESKKQLNHCKAVNTTKKWNELYHYVCDCSFHSPSSTSNRLKQITDRPEHFYIFFLLIFESLSEALWKGENENFPVNITHRL